MIAVNTYEEDRVRNTLIDLVFRKRHKEKPYSTVDGPGRRSVVQFAGCSVRCPGYYVPETHERANGKPTLIEKIVAEIDKRSGEHDRVTILGDEPFDQSEPLEKLVKKLKKKNYQVIVY